MSARMEALRQWWLGLTDRERTLVRWLGVVAAAIVVLMPVYLLQSAIGALESQNEQIAGVLAEIDRAEDRLAEREAERERAEARYRQRAPGLATFVSGRAEPLQMTVGSVTNQPDVQEGRFRRRHVRVNFPGASLRQAVRLMNEIETSPFPVAVERAHIEHFQEGDHYNVELGVITFDRDGAPGATPQAAPATAAAAAGAARAGPPPPPP